MIDRFAVHSRLFTLVAAAALGACSPSNTTDTGMLPDGMVQVDTAGMDGGTDLDGGNASDATDGRRARDMGPEINLQNEAGMCFASVTPRRGPPSSDFVVEGINFPTTMVRVAIQGPGGALLAGPTDVTVTGGSFTYHFMQAGLALGDYTASVTDPAFTCAFDAPFTVQ